MEPETGQSKLEAFKNRIKTSVVRDTFTTPEDLAYKVAASIGRFLITSKVKAELEGIQRQNDVSTDRGRDQVARTAARIQPIILGARVLLVNDFPMEVEHETEFRNKIPPAGPQWCLRFGNELSVIRLSEINCRRRFPSLLHLTLSKGKYCPGRPALLWTP